MKKILYLIFVVLKLIDDFFVKITKKSFLLKFNDFINNHFYLSLQINKKYTKFFIPNSTTKWRVDFYMIKSLKLLSGLMALQIKEIVK